MNNINRKIKSFIILLLLIQISIISYAQFNYISPKPESKYNNPETNIILKYKNNINEKLFDSQFINIKGSISGNHDFTYKLTEGSKTIILKPIIPFQNGELIEVSISKGIKLQSGIELGSFTFYFEISECSKQSENHSDEFDINTFYSKNELYSNFPSLTINVNDNPDEGKIFFHNISALASDNDRYIAIIENDGTPIYAKQENSRGVGFTLQKNGYLTYWNNKNFYMVDSSYSVIDSFACGNGYEADWHDFQIMPNGHAFIISWDVQSLEIDKKDSNEAKIVDVEGLVIQELDENKDVIFQWRSWDHYEISDGVHIDTTASVISYTHGNAIDIESDTSLLISSRLMDEITKINRNTGEIIWRLGGKHNEFTFINDEGFCRQHDIRRLSNGNITLFDNGGCHEPQVTAAKEYELDEVNKTATLVWKYEHPSKMFCVTMGNVQRLPNGNTYINWGRIPDSGMTGPDYLPAVTEVRPDNSVAYEFRFNKFFHLAYRSYRFNWNVAPVITNNTDIINEPTNFSIFPNPGKDDFTITVCLNRPENLTIKIINSSGTTIKQITNYEANTGLNSIKINTYDLNSGVYFCNIMFQHSLLTQKLIIAK